MYLRLGGKDFSGGTTGGIVDFDEVGSEGLWWSATGCEATRAWYWGMGWGHDLLEELSNYKTRYLSLRCLRD